MATPKKGITIRFEDDEMQKLEELAARYHVSSATIIRWALKALSEYVTANGGKITLPLDFSAFYRKAEDKAPALRVAEEMGTSVAMLHQHYHNPKAKEEGEAWFEVRPVSVPISSDEIEVNVAECESRTGGKYCKIKKRA